MKRIANDGALDPSQNVPVTPLVPVAEEPCRYVGRSHGVIHISRDDLFAPVGEDWQVDDDL